MEYCDAGSLTDAIVRGAFRMPALGLYGSTQPNMKVGGGAGCGAGSRAVGGWRLEAKGTVPSLRAGTTPSLRECPRSRRGRLQLGDNADVI